MSRRPKVVLLGMLTKMPVAGVTWLVAQYAVGLRRLGFDVYYVEAHARTPSMFMEHVNDNPTAKAAAFLRAELGKFGMADKWAFHALHHNGACHGMTSSELNRLYAEAALIINMHGGTTPLHEHAATGRLVYLGTDPGEVEFELERGDQRAIAALEMHSWHFTWGLNYGNPDCRLPWSSRVEFMPSPPPVVMDLWQNGDAGPGTVMTTVGNWRQPWRNLTIDGETYTWSKHHEFMKVLDLPQLVDQRFELALGSYEPADQTLLESHGWAVRPAAAVSQDSETYRGYIAGSRGEFSVAKDQNVRFRSGWFSERSAVYLAAGRPVVMQDTAFGNYLPTGEGLLSFTTLDDAIAAVQRVNSDYARHRRAAAEVAREFLDSNVVLRSLLDRCGVTPPVAPGPRRRSWAAHGLPTSLNLEPISRRPLRLSEETVDAVLTRPVPTVHVTGSPRISIVMVTHDNTVVTRLAVESILDSAGDDPYELIVVDNASSDGTRQYLEVVASRNTHVHLIGNADNRGYAAGANQGLERASGDVLVIANNDVIVTPGWVERLSAHLADVEVGAACPVTNRCGNHAEVASSYRTYGQMLAFDAERAGEFTGEATTLPMLVMFCVALRRDVFTRVGPLDERYGIGLFEDDDYAERIKACGLKLVCAEDVFVHHFGEGSFSRLYANGERSRLFELNRARFEHKWQVAWSPHSRRPSRAYENVVEEVRAIVSELLLNDAVVAVVSKGDVRLVDGGGRAARHFPAGADGSFAGHYPAGDDDAIRLLADEEQLGLTHLVLPESSFWWLDHYAGLRNYIDGHYQSVPLSTGNALVFERISRATADHHANQLTHERVHSDDLTRRP